MEGIKIVCNFGGLRKGNPAVCLLRVSAGKIYQSTSYVVESAVCCA